MLRLPGFPKLRVQVWSDWLRCAKLAVLTSRSECKFLERLKAMKA